MRVEVVRCKHCGKSYGYQSSGEGCFRPENDKDYCPDCKKAVLEALSKIPKKYARKFHGFEPTEEQLHYFAELIEREEEALVHPDGHSFPRAVRVMYCDPNYEKRWYLKVKGVSYLVDCNGKELSKENGYRIQREDEYDLLKKEFTGSSWERESSFRHPDMDYACKCVGMGRMIPKDEVPVCQNASVFEPKPVPFFDVIRNNPSKGLDVGEVHKITPEQIKESWDKLKKLGPGTIIKKNE